MKHIFGICYGALRQEHTFAKPLHECNMVIGVFEEDNDAYSHYWEVANQKYPSEEGWFGHYVVFDWATSDQLKECLED